MVVMRKAVRAIIIHDGKLVVMKRNKFGDEYYTLVGGAIDMGETAEQALVREIREETTLNVTKYRPVFVENPGAPFGPQYIYLCEYPGGEVRLPDDSIEGKITKMGKNLYSTMWLPLAELPKTKFLSETLKRAILKAVRDGFPKESIELNKSDYAGDTYGA